MNRKAFKPESLGPLEERKLLSGAAAHLARGPVAFSGVAFNTGSVRIEGYFEQYAQTNNLQLLRTQIAAISAAIPFGRVDGLGQKTNAILDQMRQDQANHVPGAIMNAYKTLSAGLKADVDARIANGTVFIFDKNG